MSDYEAEYVRKKLSDLIPGRNPRRIEKKNLDALLASIEEFGLVQPPVWNKRTGKLVGGHQRLKVLHALGVEEVTVAVRDLTEEKEHTLNITLNNKGNQGEFVDDELQVMLDIVKEYDRGLYDSLNFEELAAFPQIPDDLDDKEGETPEPPKVPTTKSGDIWVLGQHRLICGDCRDSGVLDRLFQGEQCNLAFTSPPYASQRKYDESSGFKPIPPDQYVDWFDAVQSGVRRLLADGGSWFVNIKPSADGLDTSLYVMDLVIAHVRQWGWHFATEFCWERSGVPKQVKQRFKNQFEPVYQFAMGRWKMRPESVRHKSDSVPIAIGAGAGDTGWGDARQGKGGDAVLPNKSAPGLAYPGNRLPTFGQGEALGHVAAFPIGLPRFFFLAFSDIGDICFDPFMGSGTCIMAGEKIQRQVYGVEISPAYCDVVVERWQNDTGGQAVVE